MKQTICYLKAAVDTSCDWFCKRFLNRPWSDHPYRFAISASLLPIEWYPFKSLIFWEDCVHWGKFRTRFDSESRQAKNLKKIKLLVLLLDLQQWSAKHSLAFELFIQSIIMTLLWVFIKFSPKVNWNNLIPPAWARHYFKEAKDVRQVKKYHKEVRLLVMSTKRMHTALWVSNFFWLYDVINKS